MYAGFLDVLHDPGNHHVFAIRDGVDVDLCRALQEVIDQHRTLLRVLDCFLHVLDHRLVVVRDLHRAPAQHIRGPQQHRIANLVRRRQRLFHRRSHRSWWLWDFQLFQQFAKPFTVFRQINRLRRRSDDRHARGLQRQRQVQRRLSAELDDHSDRCARRCLMLIDFQHVLQRQWLKIETIAGVVIRRNRLRIAVHHHRLETVVAQSKRRVTAAVIKLDSLPDAIRPAAQDDDLLFLGRRRLIFFFVRRIQVRRVALELGRACIHVLVDGLHSAFVPKLTHFRTALAAIDSPDPRQSLIRQSRALRFTNLFLGRVNRILSDVIPYVIDLFQLVQEPWIDRRHLRQFLHRHAFAQRVTYVRQPLRMRCHQPLHQDLRLQLFRTQPLPCLQRTHGFQQRLFERAPNGHRFAYRLHLWTESFIGAREFLELPLGNLHNHVIERRLKARRRLTRDFIRDLVERVSHCELRGNFRDRESCRLRCQCRRARYARVHLDDHHAPVDRIHTVLNVRSAGLHADLANYLDRRVAHHLVLAIRQRLRGRHGDRIAGMHAHGVEVLDRADDDYVILNVTHHLELVFFPPEHRLFQQHFMHRRKIQSACK